MFLQNIINDRKILRNWLQNHYKNQELVLSLDIIWQEQEQYHLGYKTDALVEG